MDILAFVERETARMAAVSSAGLDLAEVWLHRSPEAVSALVSAWRAHGGTSALPLTFEEFRRAVEGCVEPSDAMRRAWSRRLEAEGGPGFRDRAAALPGRLEEYERRQINRFVNHAERIVARYSLKGATARTYAHYLLTLPQSRRTFFRRWALPFPKAAGRAHSYLVASTGGGKSELIKALVYERVRSGDGVVLIDPHGELAEQVARLRAVAEAKDAEGKPRLVYFDPYLASKEGDITPVINPLERITTGTGKERVIGAIAQGVARVSDMPLTALMENVIRAVLWGLSSLDETPSLTTLAKALGDPKSDADAQALLATFDARLQDPVIRHYLKTAYLSHNLNPTREGIVNRIFGITMSPMLRNVLTGKSTIDLRAEMDRGAIMVFNVSEGQTDEKASAALGKFVVASLFSAAMERAALNDAEKREARDVFAYIDEADSMINESADEIMRKTRKYGLFLGLAQQNPFHDLPEKLAKTISNNALLKMVGSANDPGSARKLGEMVMADPEQIMKLKTGEFFFYTKTRKEGAQTRRAFVHNRLVKLSNLSNYVGWDEWQAVKEDQIARYYRHHKKERALKIDALRDRLDTGGRTVAGKAVAGT